MKWLRTLKSFQIFRTQVEKSTSTYSGWCPFQGLSNGTTLIQIHLKVMSSQIRSAWEWYQWIGLEKVISYRFLIIKFWS
jgi:catechol-2,3-dioxygenase